MPKLTRRSIPLILLHYILCLGAVFLDSAPEIPFIIVGIWPIIMFIVGTALIIPIIIIVGIDNPAPKK